MQNIHEMFATDGMAKLIVMDGWMDELFETGMLHPQEWVFMQVLNSTGTNTHTHIGR